MDAAVHLRQLFIGELAVFLHKPGARGKVLLCSGEIVCVVPVYNAGAVVIAFPRCELMARCIGVFVTGEDDPVELRHQPVVLMQPCGFQPRTAFHHAHVLRYLARNIQQLMEGVISLVTFNILRVIPCASAARNPAQRCALPGDTHIPALWFLCLKAGPPKLKAGFCKISCL